MKPGGVAHVCRWHIKSAGLLFPVFVFCACICMCGAQLQPLALRLRSVEAHKHVGGHLSASKQDVVGAWASNVSSSGQIAWWQQQQEFDGFFALCFVHLCVCARIPAAASDHHGAACQYGHTCCARAAFWVGMCWLASRMLSVQVPQAISGQISQDLQQLRRCVLGVCAGSAGRQGQCHCAVLGTTRGRIAVHVHSLLVALT